MFGKWIGDKHRFKDLKAAKRYCLDRADIFDMAYRILDGQTVIDVIDLAAEFNRLFEENS
jgi:hypothetical protein